MAELTELIGLDNWRKIKPIAIKQVLDERVHTVKTDRKVLMLVPPIHELQVDPVPAAFDMWHDAEERN